MILPMEGDAARGWTAGTPTVFLGTPADEQSGRCFHRMAGALAYFSPTENGQAQPTRSSCVRFRVPSGQVAGVGRWRRHRRAGRATAHELM